MEVTRSRPLLLALVGLITTFLAACGTSAPQEPVQEPPAPEATVVVDPAVEPLADPIPPIDGVARPLGTILDAEGTRTDFVLGELLVRTEDDDALARLLDRWHGTVLRGPTELGGQRAFLVSIDPAEADAAELVEHLRGLERAPRGEQRVSSEAARDLLAVAVQEATAAGLDASLNVVLRSDGIADGFAAEAGNANAFEWPYLNAGSNQDIGVGKAWQLLEDEGKLDNLVRYMVYDHDFIPNDDFPDYTLIDLFPNAPKKTNRHGTKVVLSAMGEVDNGYGVAGPAGPVAQLVAVDRLSGAIDWYLFGTTLTTAIAATDVQVVNISTHIDVAWWFDLGLSDWADAIFGDVRAAGALVFASAGNDGVNVDQEVCGPFGNVCWEKSATIPCESAGVVCVGGMRWDATERDAGSNWGSESNGRSVDIYGPHEVYGLEDPGDPDVNQIHRIRGTSFASPFVGGVAALVMAADPDLGPGTVASILRDSAHVGGVAHPNALGNQYRVNALGAVKAALGIENVPPTVEITAVAPGHSGNVATWFELEAEGNDLEDGSLPVSWYSSIDGLLMNASQLPFGGELSEGEHVITASVVDSDGGTASDQVTVTVTDTPPVVEIHTPTSDTPVYAGDALLLSGGGYDPDTDLTIDEEDLSWYVVQAADQQPVFAATGSAVQVPPGTLAPGLYVVRLAGQADGSVASAQQAITVLPPDPGRPTAVVTSPAPHEHFFVDQSDDGGAFAVITAEGYGVDDEDGDLAGTDMIWYVTHAGKRTAVCIGGSVPITQSGSFALAPQGPGLAKDCGSIDLKLYAPPPGVNPNLGHYVISLVVRDSDGNASSEAAVAISVGFTPAK